MNVSVYWGVSILAIRPTNDFNKISLIPWSQLTPAQQNILMTMALNGDSIVSPFGGMLDREGLTPEARARKEREEAEQFRDSMARLEEQRMEFRRELDRIDQACAEALRENEEQQREARKELQRIQDNAYQIDMPDGSVARVYRDGDKVRTEAGDEVSPSIVRAEDLGTKHSSWDDYKHGRERVDTLQSRHEEITHYREKLHETDDKFQSGDLSADEMEAATKQLRQTMPEDVRNHLPTQEPERHLELPQSNPDRLGSAFDRAAAGQPAVHLLDDKDFDAMQLPPSASKPALK